MEIRADATAAGGVTFVRVILENPLDRSVHVRLVSTLDGPIWPPRRRGRMLPGWDRSGYEGHVDGKSTLALGFASPATPNEDPVAVETRDAFESGPPNRAPETALRWYADPRPPRAVLVPHPGFPSPSEDTHPNGDCRRGEGT